MSSDLGLVLNNYWPILIDLIRKDDRYSDITESINWLNRLVMENVPFGKQLRALSFLQFYQELVPVRSKSQDELSFIVAWCIEIMQTAYLIADDIMDNSETRRGNPCWYRLPDVGLMAINDSLLLENLVYELIRNSFQDKSMISELTQMFLHTSYKTILGQALDTKMGMEKNYDNYTMATYNAIVKYKTSYYTIYQPAALALILAGKTEHLKPVEVVSLQLGNFFQSQDDFIDCYSDPDISGKVGTDIVDAKCSWLAVKALELANNEQRKTFQECYGVKDSEAETKIKKLYNELNIKEIYEELQAGEYVKIREAILALHPQIPKQSFLCILTSLYKREK